MKILVAVFHFPPISGGGVVVITEIINKLVDLGNDVTVITPDLEWNGEIYDPKINQKIKVIRTVTPSKSNIKIAARRCQTQIKETAIELGKKEKFDCVFTIFHPFHLVPKAAVEAASELKIPSIVKVDDAIYEKAKGMKSIQRKIEKMINGKTLRNSNYVLVPNDETKNIVQEEYGVKSEKISIIPNGVDLSLFEKAIKTNPRKIIFTGAMYFHRGLDILLEAAPKIIKEVSDAKFVLIGSGAEMENLKQMVQEKNLQENIEFKGWIDRKNIPKNISDAVVGIGPLRLTDVTKGALPIKVLEYMASGLPIIAKTGTVPKEILTNNENGFLVNDSSDLAEKIIYLLKNEELTESMGKKSIAMVQKFSWEQVVKDILDITKKN